MNENGLEKAEQYAREVLDGKIKTGKLTRLAIQRHQTDLKKARHRGLFYCQDSAYRVIKLFDYLKHSKGEWAGQAILLEPWQCWILACVFGWKDKETENRRFRTVYEEVARKNAKTTKLAGIGLYGLTKDSEGGPEIYSAATKREQSRILFTAAKHMVSQSKPLARRLENNQHQIINPRNFGKFEALSADGQTMDGLNPHFALIDELHAHKTSEVWDVLKSALGARSQPLMWAITTAGFNKNGICYEIRDYAVKVLTGAHQDDSFFSIIYTLDDGDDWQNQDNWIKANPNLGVSLKLDYLQEQAKQAAVMPTAKVNFLTKHCNIWVTGASLWCNVEKWLDCGADYTLEDLQEAVEVYLALDLSTVSDIASLAGIAIMPNNRWRVFGRHYLPEDTVNENLRKSPAPYKHWHEQGWLTLTGGNIIDYNHIKSDVLHFMQTLPVKEIGFDRWNSSQLVNDLMEENAPMIAIGQGFASMNAPMKELERRYLSCEIEHMNDPVLNWTMTNVVANQDPAGNIKPDKSKSSEKIDPAVALIMAVGRAMLQTPPDDDVGLEFW